MKLLVTGGAGFIGSHIVELALSRGWEVAALDNLSSGKRENLPSGVRLYEVDIRDRQATTKAFQDFQPSAVSHQAAQASVSVSMKDPALDAEVNVVGGIIVAEAARDVGANNFVFASTGGAIYGNIAQGAANESYPPDPMSPYAIHKYTFEKLLRVYRDQGALSPTVLRYANVFGPRQDPHGEAGVVAIFLNRLAANQWLAINGKQTKGDDGCVRDYVYVSDVAEANLRALEGKLDVPLLNVGTGVATDTAKLARELLALSPGSTSTIGPNDPRAGDVERSVLDGSLFREKVGEFKSLEDGLQLTAAWYHQR